MPIEINMLSSATKIKGQGVGSAYIEQVGLIKQMSDKYVVYENKIKRTDIVHYHTIDLKFALSKCFMTSKGTSIAYVHMLPESVDGSLKLPRFIRKIFYRYMIWFYKSMNHIVTVNPYFVNVLCEKYHIPKERITYIPNYVSNEYFHPVSPKAKAEFRKKYDISPDAFVVMSAGQLQVRKGFFDFMKIAEKMPDVTFIWAGGFSFGSITDGYNEIQNIINNPPDNVRFLGIVERENMNEVYNLSDVMFLGSFFELFPMIILEAMCVNLPILLRNLPIYEDILFDFYLKQADVDGFVSCINRLKTDKEFYDNACQMSKKGNDFYSKDNIMKMWDNFYSKVYNSLPKKKRKAVK